MKPGSVKIVDRVSAVEAGAAAVRTILCAEKETVGVGLVFFSEDSRVKISSSMYLVTIQCYGGV